MEPAPLPPLAYMKKRSVAGVAPAGHLPDGHDRDVRSERDCRAHELDNATSGHERLPETAQSTRL